MILNNNNQEVFLLFPRAACKNKLNNIQYNIFHILQLFVSYTAHNYFTDHNHA